MNRPSRPMVVSVKPSQAPRPRGYVRNTRSSVDAGSMKIAPSTFRLFCRRERRVSPEVTFAPAGARGGEGRRAPEGPGLDLVVALGALLGPLGRRLRGLRAGGRLRHHVDEDRVRH